LRQTLRQRRLQRRRTARSTSRAGSPQSRATRRARRSTSPSRRRWPSMRWWPRSTPVPTSFVGDGAATPSMSRARGYPPGLAARLEGMVDFVKVKTDYRARVTTVRFSQPRDLTR